MENFRFDHAWTKVVEEDVTLGITVLTDTLPALSCLATVVEQLCPDKYIAGLWEKDIAYQLSYFLDNWAPLRPHLAGPSFSWVTARRHARWPTIDHDYEARYGFVSNISTLATANRYGHVIACSTTLQGQMMEAAGLLHFVKSSGRNAPIQIRMDDVDCDLSRFLNTSTSTTEETVSVVAGLVLYQYEDEHNNTYFAILLLQRDTTAARYNSGVYQARRRVSSIEKKNIPLERLARKKLLQHPNIYSEMHQYKNLQNKE